MPQTQSVAGYGDVPATWEVVPLPEVVFFQEGPGLRNWQWTDSGMKVINVTNILGDGQIDTENTKRFIALDEFDRKYRHFAVDDGDMVVASSGNTYGKTGRISAKDLPVMMNTSVIRLRSGSKHRLDDAFLYAFIRSKVFRDQIESFVIGSAQPNFGPSHLKRMVMPLPPLVVQRRIAGILSAYDELIENSQRRIQILETMARALYREWFVHFRFPGHEKTELVRSPIGDIPEGWQATPLRALMADEIGGGWGKDEPDVDYSEPAWVIRGTDIPAARGSQVATVPHRFHKPSSLRSRKLAEDDIVFEVSGGSKGQLVGRTLMVTRGLLSAFEGDVICASFCKRVRPAVDAYGAELLYLSFLEGYESGEIEQYQVQSTGISNFKWTEYIANTQRAVPPRGLRIRFRDAVAPIFAQLATIGLQVGNLRRTRDLLLPRLLSGQLTVETGGQ